MDGVFHALANEARRDMLGRLAAGDLTVGQLAAPLTMSLAAASKHVQVLERAGLVRRRVEGRRHVCRLEPGPLASACAWLRAYERCWGDGLMPPENRSSCRAGEGAPAIPGRGGGRLAPDPAAATTPSRAGDGRR